MVKFTFETDEKEITLVSIKIDYRNNSVGVGLLQKATELLESIKSGENSTTVPNIVVEPTSNSKKSDTSKSTGNSPPPEMMQRF